MASGVLSARCWRAPSSTPLNAWWTGAELEIRAGRFGQPDGHCRPRTARPRRSSCLPACPALERVYVARQPTAWRRCSGRVATRLSPTLESVIGPPSAVERPCPRCRCRPSRWSRTRTRRSSTPPAPRANRRAPWRTAPQRNLGGRGRAVPPDAQPAAAWRQPLPEPDPSAPQKAALLAVPFFHVTGCMAVINGALADGRPAACCCIAGTPSRP